MIVVSDTSPLNYLVLIHQDHILPALFGRVLVPPAVIAELATSKAPMAVAQWVNDPPQWLEIQAPQSPQHLFGLAPGETEAIALAEELQADVLLMDERDGVAAARSRNLFVTGTLGVLAVAAERGLLSLPDAIAALQKTNFRAPASVVNELLRRDAKRRSN